MGKTQLVSLDCSHKNGAIDMKMNGSVLEKKIIFLNNGVDFLYILNLIGALTLYLLLKLHPGKLHP